MSLTSTITNSPSRVSPKTFQPLVPKVDPAITRTQIGASFNRNFVRDQFSLPTWLCFGAILQTTLFLTLKPSHAALPLIVYTIWTIGSLLHASFGPATPNPHVTYHRTTALVPDSEGEIRSGKSGEKVAVLHLGFKNYSPLGVAAPGAQTIFEYAPAMIAELEAADGREKYGFLGADTFFQASSPTSTSASGLMLVMYFRSLDGVHAYAQSELHRKAWDWYHNFTKGNGVENKHLGIMHEVFEAPAGRWESVHVNIEKTGLGKASVHLEDGSRVSTMVDASKGVLASAKGRIS